MRQNHTSSLRPSVQLVNEIKGKYSFVSTSSEAFAARKQVEIEFEEQHNSGKDGDLLSRPT